MIRPDTPKLVPSRRYPRLSWGLFSLTMQSKYLNTNQISCLLETCIIQSLHASATALLTRRQVYRTAAESYHLFLETFVCSAERKKEPHRYPQAARPYAPMAETIQSWDTGTGGWRHSGAVNMSEALLCCWKPQGLFATGRVRVRDTPISPVIWPRIHTMIWSDDKRNRQRLDISIAAVSRPKEAVCCVSVTSHAAMPDLDIRTRSSVAIMMYYDYSLEG